VDRWLHENRWCRLSATTLQQPLGRGCYTDLNQFLIDQTLERSPGRMRVSDEAGVLRGLREFDAQIIAAIYDQFFPQVFRYVLYRVGDRQTAEDLASEVFLRLLEAVGRQRGPDSNLKGWLLATASHAVSDHHRRSYRRPVEPLTESFRDALAEPPSTFDERERTRAVREAYRGLTEEQQHVLALRFGQGYSLEETAQLVGKQVNAVKSLQFRALASLQRHVGKDESESAA